MEGERSRVDTGLRSILATHIARELEDADMDWRHVVFEQKALCVLELPLTTVLGAGAFFVDDDDLNQGLHFTDSGYWVGDDATVHPIAIEWIAIS